MSADDLHVHLISNVAPDIFPENNPSKFSTPLANEINLGDGEWEVAVRHIMYPTKIATTVETDKVTIYQYDDTHRHKLPYPPVYLKSVADSGASIKFKPGNIPKSGIKQYCFKAINASIWKHVIKLVFNESDQKFVLHVEIADMVIILNTALQKMLGFKKDIFLKGEHKADKPFNANAIVPSNINTDLHIVDLTVLHHERHHLLKSIDSRGHVVFEKTISHIFTDSLPDEFNADPKFSFGIYPNEGCIKLKPLHPDWLKIIGQHENKIVFFKFDINATRVLQLNNMYYFQGEDEIKIPLVSIQQKMNRQAESATEKKVKAEEESVSILEQLSSIYVTLYYLSRNDELHIEQIGNTFVKPIAEPVHALSLKQRQHTKKPSDLLSQLNAQTATYSYEFLWKRGKARFVLNVKDHKYAIRLSESLASILGFDPTKQRYVKGEYMARDSPLLNRDITGLYVYTNIVDSVYIGDVKAPLLLTCPFQQKGSHDIVHQLEFLNPTYTSLNRSVLKQIDIAIYDDAGALVPFLYGKTKLSLHFRRRQ